MPTPTRRLEKAVNGEEKNAEFQSFRKGFQLLFESGMEPNAESQGYYKIVKINKQLM